MTAKATGICMLTSLFISLTAHGSDTDACISSFAAGQLEQARQQCEPLADQGFPEANFIMARITTDTQPVDYPKAIYWLQRATELEHAEAAYNLGIAYQTGTGITKDLPLAIKTYQQSASLGNAKAQRNLGLMYSAGIGTAQNYPKAFEYFTASAGAGEAASQYNLGIMYLQGTGTAPNPGLAQEWLTRAAENGDSNAQMTLGVMLQDSDLDASLLWYNRAAEQNNPYALYNLAILYWQDERLEQDLKQATYFARQAEQQGHSKGTELLAQINRQTTLTSPSLASEETATVATTAGDKGLRDTDWVMQQPKREYFAQLTQLKTRQEIEPYLRQHNLTGLVDYFPVKTKLGEVYIILFRDSFDGVVTTRTGMKGKVPDKISKNAWIRTFESLQNGIKQ
ncbi:hypothetical protein [Aliamphritea hakodatensis]|uniref:hypothetical protein n=1 Tax=Aliamphritea hakodatensis TaxID=2895352 RepID=UPI0022FD8C8A|nr:hypothetical protein [Aliamphritea hakodatensis]